MWFLIRTLIWLVLLMVVPLVQLLVMRPRNLVWVGLALAALPIFNDEASTGVKNEKGFELGDALGAAAGAISYMGSLCSEKPDVCAKGAETFAALGSRARDGARVAYTYLDTKSADAAETGADDAVLTGTVAVREEPRRIPIPLPRPKDI
jgi:hypothetical protein